MRRLLESATEHTNTLSTVYIAEPTSIPHRPHICPLPFLTAQLQKYCMKPEQPLFWFVLETAQRAAFACSHIAVSHRFSSNKRDCLPSRLGCLGRKEISVTNFNFLLRISIHRKERRLLEVKNDRLLWGKWFDLLSNHPKSWVLEGDYVIKISFENNSIFFFNFCRENTNLLQILTKLCFLEKMSMKSKNERWKIMKKTFITVI